MHVSRRELFALRITDGISSRDGVHRACMTRTTEACVCTASMRACVQVRVPSFIRSIVRSFFRSFVRSFVRSLATHERDAARDRAEKRIARMQLHAAAERGLTNGS